MIEMKSWNDVKRTQGHTNTICNPCSDHTTFTWLKVHSIPIYICRPTLVFHKQQRQYQNPNLHKSVIFASGQISWRKSGANPSSASSELLPITNSSELAEFQTYPRSDAASYGGARWGDR